MIRFVKIIRIVNEGEIYKPSLFAFGKIPWLMREKKDHKGADCVQYKYMIYINLWLLEIELRFLGRIKQ